MKEITQVQRDFIVTMINFYRDLYSEEHAEFPGLELLLQNGKYSTSGTTGTLTDVSYNSDKDFINSWKEWYVRKRENHIEL